MGTLCHLLSVWLATTLLLLPATTELTAAHSFSHMTREEGSRMRRSAADSNDTDAPHDVTHTPELSDAATRPSGKSVDVSVTPPPAGAFGGNEPQNSSHEGLPGNTSAVTPPSVATDNTSSVLNPAAAITSSASSSSSSSIPPALEPPHTPGAVMASPAPTGFQSVTSAVPPPVTSSSDNKTANAASTVYRGNATSVSAAPGDNAGMNTTTHNVPTTNATNAPNATSAAAVLPPDPGHKVTEVVITTTTTTTTTKPSSPVTPKRPDCPVFTQPSPWQPGHTNNKSLVGNCLIAIATLAGLATFFMACSIVLCTRLSAAKQRYRFHMRRAGLGMGEDLDDGTEMVCISALMPDGDGPPMSPATNHSGPVAAPRRHRFPKSNGALIPVTTDTDSDGGDNLTLNSFLPDGDRTPCDGDPGTY